MNLCCICMNWWWILLWNVGLLEIEEFNPKSIWRIASWKETKLIRRILEAMGKQRKEENEENCSLKHWEEEIADKILCENDPGTGEKTQKSW